jgi:uncharacterized protein (DUF885 family)
MNPCNSIIALIIFGVMHMNASTTIAAPTATKPEASASTKKSGASASQALSELLAAADAEDLRFSPQSAVARGDLSFAGEFGDLISDAYIAQTRTALEGRLAALARIDRSALSTNEQIAYDVFRYLNDFALRGHRNGFVELSRQLAIDHLFGQHIVFPQFSSGSGIAPFNTLKDYEDGLTRLDGFVLYLDRVIVKMRDGIRAKQTLPRASVDKVIVQLSNAIDGGVDNSPFFAPARTFPSSIAPDTRERLAAAYRERVSARVLPAYIRLRSFFLDEYLPRARTGAPGYASFANADKIYAHAIESHTTVAMSPEKIYALGVSEVRRIRAEMDAIRARVGFKGTLTEFFTHLQTDPRFQPGSKEALLASYRAVESRVRAILPKYFEQLPRGGFEVRAIPLEQENSAGGAYYQIGTPDGSRPGVFYVNTSNLPTRTSPRTTALFLHEAIPGHHLQGTLAAENVALPALLRFTWNPGYGEGWALYCEWLGREMGLYDDPYQDFGRLDMEMIRAVRLVVDTGLHAKGWSREQAIEYMLQHTTLDRAAVEQEIDRYAVWPGQAVSYKVGDVFLRELRARAEKALGKRFDIRKFHSVVLDTGALPLAVLERKVDAWIRASKPR